MPRRSHRFLTSLRYVLLGLVCTGALWIGFSDFTTRTLAQVAASQERISAQSYTALERFGKAFEIIMNNYVDAVDPDRLVNAAIDGMVNELDPHSVYFDKKALEAFRTQMKGEFAGFGITIKIVDSYVSVIQTIDDGPAQAAGILAGDLIVEIEGVDIKGTPLEEIVKKLRGKEGTLVTVMIERNEERFPVTIKRAIIKSPTVYSRLEQGDIGYIQITQFAVHTTEQLETAISQLKQETPELKGVVLDLRNNGGGQLNQAISVTDTFLDSGEIVLTRGRNVRQTSRALAKKGDLINGIPMVVLINSATASASEIVAGALRDHKRALIIGTTSFGKGTVQTLFPVENGVDAIKLTIQRYYMPSGESIQAQGVTPDIVVEQGELVVDEQKIVREREIENALDVDKETSDPLLEPQNTIEEDVTATPEAPGPDRQLEVALSILWGNNFFSAAQSD